MEDAHGWHALLSDRGQRGRAMQWAPKVVAQHVALGLERAAVEGALMQQVDGLLGALRGRALDLLRGTRARVAVTAWSQPSHSALAAPSQLSWTVQPQCYRRAGTAGS